MDGMRTTNYSSHQDLRDSDTAILIWCSSHMTSATKGGGGSANAELPEKGGWRGSAISDLPDFLLSFTVLDDL